jgi:bacterioferritin-associated ferredoxin
MIVCSCNVISDGDVRACLNGGAGSPRTPAEVYRCLGCSPECGHCARTIRAVMDRALAEAEACTRGCCSANSIALALAAEPSL